MKKRILPIPLILLIPIVLLVVVVVAGVYRFSLTDEEILSKFPSHQLSSNSVMKEVFDVQSPNPWTVKVPETHAFAFIETVDHENQVASGRYDAGSQRGQLLVLTDTLTPVNDGKGYVAVMRVTSQGTGVFNYLSTFQYDQQRERMVLVDSKLLGDRITIEAMEYLVPQVHVVLNQHAEGQAMAEAPAEQVTLRFNVSNRNQLSLVKSI
ncbi:hypothetical protein [Vibrio paucivorans]|uniref:Uncharacterized protein n=1 Tax=Vibrio paucivorans TaxID=2829489 RepID=A0A9X3CB34_9VIBR|nr:hypothetical protein [Vibrio paucivorans]MCW8332419.1 hypothetical protein [Vibrio paucivorans]